MFDRDLLAGIEPSEAERGAARALYGFFIALLDEGFDESQALQLVSNLMTTVSMEAIE